MNTKGVLGLLALMGMVASVLGGCGATPEPTEAPPTQTPWIVIVTATPGAATAAEVQPAETEGLATATPTNTRRPTPTTAIEPTPSSRATGQLTPTAVLGTGTEPTSSPASETTAAPAPTDTPATGALKYPPPVLLDPPSNRPVSWNSRVVLKWAPVGELAEDEYYHLHLERPPKTEMEEWYGDYVYLKDTEYLLEGAFLAPFHPPEEQGHGVVYWWVRVVRQTGEDEDSKPIGVDVGAHSEKRTLILDPKPED